MRHPVETPALLLGCEPEPDEHFGHLPRVSVIAATDIASLNERVGGVAVPVCLHHPETGAVAALWHRADAESDPAVAWFNYAAMTLLRANEVALESHIIASGGYLAGPAVLTGSDQQTGDIAPLPREWLEILPAWFFETAAARSDFWRRTALANQRPHHG